MWTGGGVWLRVFTRNYVSEQSEEFFDSLLAWGLNKAHILQHHWLQNVQRVTKKVVSRSYSSAPSAIGPSYLLLGFGAAETSRKAFDLRPSPSWQNALRSWN